MKHIALWLLTNAGICCAVTLIVDGILMGPLKLTFRRAPKEKRFFVTGPDRIDLQEGLRCSAYASAYLLRYLQIPAEGAELYEQMPGKQKAGTVLPRGIPNLLKRYGVAVCYRAGNLHALKAALENNMPVIVMIRVRPDRNWLHYVPVVGYDEKALYLAESLPELVNAEGPGYNRRVPTEEFLTLWNTAMLHAPLYTHTFFTVETSERKAP